MASVTDEKAHALTIIDPSSATGRVLDFLAEIGIPTFSREDATGFVNGIQIVHGVLHYDPKVVRPSDLLHEAGHLAVIPKLYRDRAEDQLEDVIAYMLGDVMARFEIDSPEHRAAFQSGECEATAWAYAAGISIGLDPDDIIHPSDYDGEGESVRLQLQFNCHFGVNGLRHGGMVHSVKTYPEMLRWTQP